MWSIGTLIYEKKTKFESEYKGHKSGENPNLGHVEFMKLSGISGSF